VVDVVPSLCDRFVGHSLELSSLLINKESVWKRRMIRKKGVLDE
jgi:hypothetical protein